MGDHSKIEWTDATWNPVRGCSLVSAGCTNCYAMRDAHRFAGPGKPYDGLTKLTEHGPVWTGKVRLVPELLDQPLRWKKPRRIFVNSMSDLFHEKVPNSFIEDVWAVMLAARQHTFQVLTKRPDRMYRFLTGQDGDPWDRIGSLVVDHSPDAANLAVNLHSVGCPHATNGHIWLGVSVEDQKTADERIPILLQTPAAVRWVSAEPLLGPVDLDTRKMFPTSEAFAPPPQLDWCVVGGESGPGARPFDIGWARSIVAQCRAAGVPVFVKQLGSKPTTDHRTRPNGECHTVTLLKDRKGGDWSEWPEDLRVRSYP
jgi:protein gp37